MVTSQQQILTASLKDRTLRINWAKESGKVAKPGMLAPEIKKGGDSGFHKGFAVIRAKMDH
ncbi:Uncharacterised protein [Serratia plymuthica]|nr:Uncharacterised protein [Serratia plymuthica]